MISTRTLVGALIVSALPMVAADPIPDKIEFNTHVRPILSDKCFYCHGPDKEHRKAKLRLDLEASAKADMGDYFAIVPGKPEKSAIIQRIITRKPDELMPPPESNKVISDRERAILEKWIEQGAEYQTHWSFTPIPGPVKKEAGKNPIDAFVEKRLAKDGLKPNPPADPATLARRVYLDLTGMPPTTKEIDAFIADKRPDALSHLIDKAFKSPRYGEHMARYWLDAGRYGDTHGLHLDNFRSMWPWRDWVINAYNQNMSFDQFTIQQIAGDLLPDPTLDQQVATGFCRNNVTTSEGGSIDEEFYVRYAVDRASTVSSVFLGLTAGCASCHDHKFDPISQKEFYEMYAFFNNVAERAMDGNKAEVPPIVRVPSADQKSKVESLEAEEAKLEQQLAERKAAAQADFDKWALAENARLSKPATPPTRDLIAHYPLDEIRGAHQPVNGGGPLKIEFASPTITKAPVGKGIEFAGQFQLTAADLADFSGDTPFSYGAWLRIPASAKSSMVPFSRMNADAKFRGWDLYVNRQGQVGAHILSSYESEQKVDGLRRFSQNQIARDVWQHVFVTYDGSRKVEGIKVYLNGAEASGYVNETNNFKGTASSKAPFRIGGREGNPIRDPFRGAIDDVRIYGCELRPEEVADLHRMVEPLRLPEGLVAHFPLDELKSKGIRAVNVGNPKQGIRKVKGNPSVEMAKHGKGYRFTGKEMLEQPQVGDFERDKGFSYGAWIKPDGNKGALTAISRMDEKNAYRGYDLYIADHRIMIHILNTWPHDGLKVSTDAKLTPNQWQHVFVTYDGSSKASGIKIYVDAKEIPHKANLDRLTKTIRTKQPFRIGSRGTGSNYRGVVDEVRVYDRKLEQPEIAALVKQNPVEPLLLLPPEKRTTAQTDALFVHYLANKDPVAAQISTSLGKLASQRSEATKNLATTLVMQENMKPREAFVLKRGEYDKRGEPVVPGVPDFLPPLKQAGDRATRLELAKWLVDPKHPLTSRVTVNRYWQQLFGLGIVESADDFGSQGTLPSHPALLDHLAREFMDSGWNVQHLLKTMMLSKTYQQSSATTPDKLNKDPRNQLLSRGPRFRLDAEVIRDQALMLSGLLVEKIGGPSVKPYQPDGVWKAVGYSGSNTVKFTRDKGEKLYRRGIYTFWKRTAPPPALVTFDAPSRENCAVTRERTNTPLQALVLMNDEQFVEAARHFGTRAWKAAADPRERIGYLLREATGQVPDDRDLDALTAATDKWLATFQQAPERAKGLISVGESKPDAAIPPHELAAYTLAASTVLNLDQVISKD